MWYLFGFFIALIGSHELQEIFEKSEPEWYHNIMIGVWCLTVFVICHRLNDLVFIVEHDDDDSDNDEPESDDKK